MVSPTAKWTFLILFAMNMLDYIDRWALSGVTEKIKAEFGVSDETIGSLNMYFLISYSLISPVMGWAGDRFKRTWLLAAGVGIWSLATVGTGLARDFDHLKLARSILGIGEASYGVLAPTILMDLYPKERRSRILSSFYLAMPVGYALGVILGGSIASYTGSWRSVFFFVGVPGFLAAAAAFFLPEPVRGTSEGIDVDRLRSHEKAGATQGRLPRPGGQLVVHLLRPRPVGLHLRLRRPGLLAAGLPGAREGLGSEGRRSSRSA